MPIRLPSLRSPALTAPNLVRSLLGQPGAYVHIPFCPQICPFCPYNKVLHADARADKYFVALEEEIRRVTQAMSGSFTSLYIGGGTPTMCVEGLRRVVPLFKVDNEIAIECLPTHATPEMLDDLLDLGVTSLSLGVQSFSDDVLKHLGRPTTAADNIAALALARERIGMLDVDLMFDVAFEDEQTFLSDLERCFDADVDQVSTYPVMRFGYTPFGKASHHAAQEHRVLRAAARLAESRGYERRSVWTFNRKGSADYTSITRPFFLGFGAGAASFTGEIFTVNAFNLDQYHSALMTGDPGSDSLPVARVFGLPPALASAYAVFWQMYTGRLDIDWVRLHFGPGAHLFWRGVCEVLLRTGHLDRSDGPSLELTEDGYDRYHDLERWVTYHFIEPLWREMMASHDVGKGPGAQGAGWLRLGREKAVDPVWRVARSFLGRPRNYSDAHQR